MAALCQAAEGAETARDQWTLGGLLRTFLPIFGALLHLSARKLAVLWRLVACGSGELGENLYACPLCGAQHWAPRSCGDRHCPRCQASKSRQWLGKQMQSLLPVTYYHWVFTLPQALNPLLRTYPRQLYPLLFESGAQSLLEFGRHRLKGDLGITTVLHTWGQKLDYHPHVHCIVTGGALSPDKMRWRSSRQRKYLFPKNAVAALFRGKFLAGLQALVEKGAIELPGSALRNERMRRKWFSLLYGQGWITYAKRPFGGPKQVLSYLANYTHRVAISNRRIVSVDEQKQSVTFTYRDYRDRSTVKQLTLPILQFIQRFSLHILPFGLVRIRHYGILGNNRREADIAAARRILHQRGQDVSIEQELLRDEPMRCPRCGEAGLRFLGFTDRHGALHIIRRPPAPAVCDSS